MSVVQRGVSTANSGTALVTTMATSLPAGCQVGDLAVLLLHSAPGAAVNTAPSGWTEQINSDQGNAKVGIYTRTLTSGDITTGTATVTRTATTSWASVLGVWISAGVDAISSAQASTSVVTSVTVPAVTPGASDTLRLALVCARVDTVASTASAAPPSGWTELAESIDTHTSAKRRLTYIDSLQLTGQSGVPQSTASSAITSTTGVNYGAYSITLLPAGDTRPAPDATKLAVDGDSLTRQNGLGGSSDPGTDVGTGDIPAALVSLRAWTSGNLIAHGVTGRTIISGGPTPFIETTIAAQRTAGFEPYRRIFALGANNQSATVAANMTDIRAYLAVVGPGREVVLFGVGYYDQTDCAVTFTGGNPAGSRWSAAGGNGSPNAAMLNVIDQGTNPLTEPSIVGYYNWNDSPIVRSLPAGVAPTDVWKMDDVSSGSGQPRHMVQTGYQLYRNVALADAAGWAPGFVGPEASGLTVSGLNAAVITSASADVSSLTVAGQNAAVVAVSNISAAAEAAAYTVAGQNATATTASTANAPAEAAAYTVAGQDPTVTAASNAPAESAALTFTAQNAAVTTAAVTTAAAEAATYALTAGDAGPAAVAAAEAALYTVAADTPAAGTGSLAETASFITAGQDAAAQVQASGAVAAYTVAGQDAQGTTAGITNAFAQSADWVAAGADATAATTATATAESAALTLTGQNPAASTAAATNAGAEVAAVALAGLDGTGTAAPVSEAVSFALNAADAVVVTGSNTAATAQAAALSVAASDASVPVVTTASAEVASLSLIELNPQGWVAAAIEAAVLSLSAADVARGAAPGVMSTAELLTSGMAGASASTARMSPG